jgi:oxygen-dependent protoporphyrinogen oxidase
MTHAGDVVSARGERHVVVVGGGITGLAAAHALLTATSGTACRVTVLEADDRVGGKIRTTPFAGHAAIDEGPDAFLARLPWGTSLAQAVGLGGSLVSPSSGRAAIWYDSLHPIPEGLLLGMPTGVRSLARSRLLPWGAKLRAATEPFRRRTPTDADSLGAYVRDRFGDEVHLRLVDPLVGSIYAADTDRFSLAAVPQIAEIAARSRSVLAASRHRPPAPSGPVFYAPQAGLGALVDHVAAAVTAAGGTIRTGAAVTAIEPDGAAWRVDGEPADAVVLAVPAPAAARLLAGVTPDAAPVLAGMPLADVALLTMAVPALDWPDRLRGMSGYLVPKPVQRLVTAASFGSQKWSHWDDGRQVVLRVSLGRDGLPVLQLDDDALVAATVDEVSRHLGLDLAPTDVRVSRWAGAFPQYRPHHAERVAALEAQLPAGIAVAGASHHGIGIPACIHSAQRAAATLAGQLGTVPD